MRLRGAYSLLALITLAVAPSAWWGSWLLLALSAILASRDRLASCILAGAGILASKPESVSEALLLAFAGFVHAWYSPPGRPWRVLQPVRYIVVASILSASSLLYPPLLPAAAGMAAGVSARYSRAASRLSGSRLEARAPRKVPLGGVARISVRVYGPPGGYYSIRVSGLGVARGRIPEAGVAVEDFAFQAERFGAYTVRVEARVYDPEYTASALAGEELLRIVAFSRMAYSRDSLAALLSAMAGRVGAPRLLYVREPLQGRGEGRGGRAGWRPAWHVLEYAPVPVRVGLETLDVESIREYVPGDPPRLIYWKKSLATGRMVVKQLARRPSGEGSPAGTARLVVAASLTAWNWAELDRLVSALVEAVSSAGDDLILFLRMPGGREYLVAGKPLDVANALEAILTREPPTPLSLGAHALTVRPPLQEAPGRLSSAWKSVQERVWEEAASILSAGVMGGASYLVLHSPLEANWAGLLAGALESAGLRRARIVD